MKAIAVIPGTTAVRLVDRPEPSITAPDEVKARVMRVGICGTDREEAAGGRAKAPSAHDDLVMGHEMFGQVVDVGTAVTQVKTGDYALFTVRRGCGQCRPCMLQRSDMCRTGLYTERGIWGLDGYQTEYVVDHEPFVVRVPDSATSLDWLAGKRCLVAGLGPVGLLAALSLRLREADVWGLDIVDAETVRPRWLTAIGGHYLDGRKRPFDRAKNQIGSFDMIFEATGIASLQFELLDALALDGVYAVAGIPSGDQPLSVEGSALMRRLVLQNQLIVGSVNASRDHFQLAVHDLSMAERRWPGQIARLITHRHPYTDFEAAFQHHGSDEIKVVLDWQSDRVGRS
jgi:glucose 1-dehydrogenase